jgi:hypothetical protein
MSSTAAAQGQGHGQGQGQGQGQGHTSRPPSQSAIAAPIVVAAPVGAAPFAWLEDATIMEPGSVSASMSVTRWDGSGGSEVDLPVVDVAIGLAERVHLTAAVPRVVDGSAVGGPAGGVGTSFFSAKVAILDGHRTALKVAAAPTLELLGEGAAQSLTPGAGRVQFGVPLSAEIDRGRMRWFGGGGWFSGGVWFGGAGAALRATPRIVASASLTRSWRRDNGIDPTLAAPQRTDVSGAIGYALTPRVSAFASVGHTIATLDENGAGATVGAGLSFFLPPARR